MDNLILLGALVAFGVWLGVGAITAVILIVDDMRWSAKEGWYGNPISGKAIWEDIVYVYFKTFWILTLLGIALPVYVLYNMVKDHLETKKLKDDPKRRRKK